MQTLSLNGSEYRHCALFIFLSPVPSTWKVFSYICIGLKNARYMLVWKKILEVLNNYQALLISAILVLPQRIYLVKVFLFQGLVHPRQETDSLTAPLCSVGNVRK